MVMQIAPWGIRTSNHQHCYSIFKRNAQCLMHTTCNVTTPPLFQTMTWLKFYQA